MAEFMFSSTPHYTIRMGEGHSFDQTISEPRIFMTMGHDGRLVPGDGLSEDEATQRMFKHLQEMFRFVIRGLVNRKLDEAAEVASRRFSKEITMSVEFSRRGSHVEADKRIACSAVAQIIAEDIRSLKSKD